MENGCYGARRDMHRTETWNGISIEWHGLMVMVVEDKGEGFESGCKKSTAYVDGQDLRFGQDIISKV